MKKREALAEHDKTWKQNGIKQIESIVNISLIIQGEAKCGDNCERILISLPESEDAEAMLAKEGIALEVTKDVQQDLFKQDIEDQIAENEKKMPPPQAFNNLVKLYYDMNLYRNLPSKPYNELEVRFATKGIKQLTKNDYDNVVKLLKSFGFTSLNPTGTPSLRIRCEFLDSSTGRFKMSDVRTEIDGIVGIEKYCKSDDIKSVFKQAGTSVKFNSKRSFMTDDKKIIRPVDMRDFNFRVSLNTEETAKKGVENYIIENWRKSKKEFRYLNRVTFQHVDYPFNVDLSIVKSGTKAKDKR
jgi:hypothetical protein